MIAILGFSMCLLMILLVIPDSPLGRVLHRDLVEKPLERLAKLERHHLIYGAILAAVMIPGGELVALAGSELVAMWALDLAIYIDAVLVTYALSAIATVRGARTTLAQVVTRRLRRRPRARRHSRHRVIRQASNDDDDAGPAYEVIAA